MAEITPGQAYGFFTDTSVCIGCKACEVACKQWNQLPGNEPAFLDGFDNTGSLDDQNWRHVQFIDNVPDTPIGTGQGKAWLMMSDVCKHCQHASCMDVCPTGAIIRTEFDTVYIQPSVCNGCRDCISACPYSVIGFDEDTHVAGKRVADLHAQGVTEARLYGDDDSVYGGLNAFFLLMDKPEAYNLPNAENAVLPKRNNPGGYLTGMVTAVLGVFAGLVALRRRRPPAQETPPPGAPPQGGPTREAPGRAEGGEG